MRHNILSHLHVQMRTCIYLCLDFPVQNETCFLRLFGDLFGFFETKECTEGTINLLNGDHRFAKWGPVFNKMLERILER